MSEKRKHHPNSLWSRDFTIITLGSAISMLGNSMTGFAMMLKVLDFTGSTLLYSIFMIVYTAPQFFMQIFSGALLDRFSRKKTIYTLDFISAGLYAFGAWAIGTDWITFPIIAILCGVIGSIQSIYMVAYGSFYPLLISKENYSKGYSIATMLETASAAMIPISIVVYRSVGVAPLLAFNAVSFCVAAIIETQIKTEEKYIDTQKQTRDYEASNGRQMIKDVREGRKYLLGEKGLLFITIYFTFTALAAGAANVTTLPYFKGHYENGEFIYMVVWGMALVGRAIGGWIQYRIHIPAKKRFNISLVIYMFTCLVEAWYLFLPVWNMVVLCFLSGLLGATSYNIRIASTQNYVPDELKGRFNGVFNMLNGVGSLSGQLTAGMLTVALGEKWVINIFLMINFFAALIFVAPNKKHIDKVFKSY